MRVWMLIVGGNESNKQEERRISDSGATQSKGEHKHAWPSGPHFLFLLVNVQSQRGSHPDQCFRVYRHYRIKWAALESCNSQRRRKDTDILLFFFFYFST